MLKAAVRRHLDLLVGVSPEGLFEQRLQRYRRMGVFREEPA
jgi:hypothetical protein